MDEVLRLGVTFEAGDASPQELEQLTAALRRELLALDVTSVDRVSTGAAPAGSRGIDLAAVGALAISLTKATPLLGQVIAVIQAWSARHPDRTAELTLDGDTLKVGGLSEQEQNRLIEEWMARHATPASPPPATTMPTTPTPPSGSAS